MAGKRKKLFKSSLRGYKKQDVQNFIEELDRTARSEKEILESRIAELSKKNEELCAKISEYESAIAEARDLRERFEMLASDIEAQNQAIAETVQENEDLKRENELLKKDAQEKVNLGDKAKEMAEKILDNAREESEKIRAQSEELLSINLKKIRYLYRRRDEIKEAFALVKEKTDSVLGEITGLLDNEEN